MENFEKYLRDNRDELDRMEAFDSDKMWEGISNSQSQSQSQSQAPVKRLRPVWKWVAIAASMTALIGWALYFFQPPAEEQIIVISIDDISPELAQREADLKRLISQKEKEVGLDTLNAETYAEVFKELAELDANSEATIWDMSNGSANERAVETLLRQYELKIRILENLSREIDKKQYHEELEKEI